VTANITPGGDDFVPLPKEGAERLLVGWGDDPPAPPPAPVAPEPAPPEPVTAVIPTPRTLEQRLADAQREGLAANLRRALAFVGNRGPVEFQVLGVRSGRWRNNGAAHALDVEQAVQLCTSADAEMADGVYLIPSELRAGVETRVVIPP
jgi:hypothetical protein